MDYFKSASFCLLLLTGLTACGPSHVYLEPTREPRANLRVFGNGAVVKYYPAATCFSYNNPASGWQADGSRLIETMPLRPDVKNFGEVYVKADEPIAISFDYASIKNTATGGYATTACGPIGISFVPSQTENYEAAFHLSDDGCGVTLEKIVKNASGHYQRVQMTPDKASKCKPKGSLGAWKSVDEVKASMKR